MIRIHHEEEERAHILDREQNATHHCPGDTHNLFLKPPAWGSALPTIPVAMRSSAPGCPAPVSPPLDVQPEFINRLDKIVVFKSLGTEDLRRIIDIELELELVQERL
jgi:hypothetical protein